MTKNPILNALAAGAYIVLIGGILYLGTRLKVGAGNTFVAPVVMIALFTLSAAVMGYIFCYQPGVLYFEGKRKAGVGLFIKTVGVFGLITLAALVLLFTGILR